MLELLERYDISNPLELSLFNRKKARLNRDYELYISQFYNDLEDQINNLSERRAYYYNQGEEVITDYIINGLYNRNYPISYDGFANGHADINLKDSPFSWFGESKLQKSIVKTYDGFNQLTTRYSSANDNGYRGGILIFHQRPVKPALNSLAEWRQHLIESCGDIDIICGEIQSKKLYFDTSQTHSSSGNKYLIRHFWIDLGFDPKK